MIVLGVYMEVLITVSICMFRLILRVYSEIVLFKV